MSTLRLNCRRTTGIKIEGILCKAAKAGGKQAFNVYKAAHNNFVGNLSGLANGAITVIEPLLEIDAFVLKTFVKPSLEATIKILDTTTKTIKVPLNAIRNISVGANDDGERCREFHLGLRSASDGLIQFQSWDLTFLRNRLDGMENYIEERQKFVEELKGLAEAISSLQVDSEYEEFVKTKCQTT